MIETPDALRDAVWRAIRANPLADSVRDVRIEPARDGDDGEFLRISLLSVLPDQDVDFELESLLEGIEEAVSTVDDRYASVRFLDAA